MTIPAPHTQTCGMRHQTNHAFADRNLVEVFTSTRNWTSLAPMMSSLAGFAKRHRSTLLLNLWSPPFHPGERSCGAHHGLTMTCADWIAWSNPLSLSFNGEAPKPTPWRRLSACTSNTVQCMFRKQRIQRRSSNSSSTFGYSIQE